MLAGQGWTTVGTLNPGQGKPLSYVVLPSIDGAESAWTVNVMARNGSTIQFLEMRFNRGIMYLTSLVGHLNLLSWATVTLRRFWSS